MFNHLNVAMVYAKNFIQEKKGAVAFEYVLIIGGVSVVVIGLLAAGATSLFPQLVLGVCNAMNDLNAFTVSCAGIIPAAGP